MHIVRFILHPRNLRLPTDVVKVVLAFIDAPYFFGVWLGSGVDELFDEDTQEVEQNNEHHDQLHLVEQHRKETTCALLVDRLLAEETFLVFVIA